MNAVTQESLEPVLFDLVLEGATANAQKLSRLGPVLVGLAQCIHDHLFLSHMGDATDLLLERGR